MYDFLSVIIFEGGGSFRLPILGGRERRPPTTVGWQKTRGIALSCGVKNIASRFFGLVTKTDGQTVRITTPKTALAHLRRAVIKMQ